MYLIDEYMELYIFKSYFLYQHLVVCVCVGVVVVVVVVEALVTKIQMLYHTHFDLFLRRFPLANLLQKQFPNIVNLYVALLSTLCFKYVFQWDHSKNILVYRKYFSCDQAATWLVQSVRLSVCLSVCPSVTPFSPCSHHRIIKFSGVITMVRSDVHVKGQGQRSKVKVTEVNTQLSRFWTLTPVWIHIWQWNHAHSWKQHRRGALLFFKVIRQISRSHGSKNRRIWPKLGVSGL